MKILYTVIAIIALFCGIACLFALSLQAQAVKLPTTTPTQVSALCLTTVAASAVSGSPVIFYKVVVSVLKQEIYHDYTGVGYTSMTLTAQKVSALQKRALDTNPLTLMFSTPTIIPIYAITSTAWAGIK